MNSRKAYRRDTRISKNRNGISKKDLRRLRNKNVPLEAIYEMLESLASQSETGRRRKRNNAYYHYKRR